MRVSLFRYWEKKKWPLGFIKLRPSDIQVVIPYLTRVVPDSHLLAFICRSRTMIVAVSKEEFLPLFE